jgi:uncharacterized membrane protein YphA (DoxX/SURF4 family)
VSRLTAWLLRPAPPERLASLRILVGAYVVVFMLARLPSFWSATTLPERQWRPVGVLVPLGSPLPPGVAQAMLLATIGLGVAFLVGWRFRVVGPLFAVVFLVATTYRLSWGQVNHTEHLVAIHVLILGLVPAAHAWSVDAAAGRADPATVPPPRFGWPVKAMAVALVAGYVLAGIAKVRNGGMDWMVGDVLRNQVAYDNLRKILLGDIHSPVGGWTVRFAWLFPPLAIATTVIELGAPLALLGGRWRTVWALSAWLFHVGIVALMAISFPYPLSGVAYASLFASERLFQRFGLPARYERWATRRYTLDVV